MKVAVDAMGGDFAPRDIVRGAVQAARDYRLDIVGSLKTELASVRARVKIPANEV